MTTPLIYGPYDAPVSRWLPHVFRVMKDSGRYGVAVVVPDGAAARAAFDEAFAGFAESGEGYRLLTEIVGITLTPAAAQEAFGAKENVILLSPGGKPIHTLRVSVKDIANATKFSRAVRSAIPEGTPAWLTNARSAMKKSGRRGIILIAPEDEDERQRFGRALLARYDDPATRPLFGRAVFIGMHRSVAAFDVSYAGNRVVLSPDGRIETMDAVPVEAFEESGAFRAAFEKVLDGATGDPHLPYGCVMPTHPVAAMFGTNYDPCPACGMPRVDDSSWRFLNFLTV